MSLILKNASLLLGKDLTYVARGYIKIGKDGIIEEALVETIGCSGMTHSAAMASEILPGKTILEAFGFSRGFVKPYFIG